MFEGPIVAAYELKIDDQWSAADTLERGPIAGIALALPFSLAIWAIALGAVRLWF